MWWYILEICQKQGSLSIKTLNKSSLHQYYPEMGKTFNVILM